LVTFVTVAHQLFPMPKSASKHYLYFI